MQPQKRTVVIDPEIKAIAAKRIRSAFIYALFELEKDFGDLWGEHKEENAELTDSEAEFEKMFMKWRAKILDYGNGQIRLCDKELERILK